MGGNLFPPIFVCSKITGPQMNADENADLFCVQSIPPRE
jgi:hypothetical protein